MTKTLLLLFAVKATMWAQSYAVGSLFRTYTIGDHGPASAALLSHPGGLAFDASGNLLIGDGFDLRVRIVTPSGQIDTFAGNGSAVYAGDGGPAASASLSFPYAIAVDGNGNVYISDTFNHRVRKVDSNGIITTFAGDGGFGGSGDGGQATSAQLAFYTIGGLATDSAGNVYISDPYNHKVRKVTVSTGIITTFAGTGQAGYTGDGQAANAAQLSTPQGLAVDSAGNLYIADSGNFTIRKVSTNNVISTVAGTGVSGSTGDGGPASAATLSGPIGIAIDGSGNLYVADPVSNSVRKISNGSNPVITTFAGNGSAGFSGDGGSALSAQLFSPNAVTVSKSGVVYIADSGNSRVRVVDQGIIQTYAGADHSQGDGGPVTDALAFFASGVATDRSGNAYVADNGNNRVRKINFSTGVITTIAGNGSPNVSGDGGQATSAGLPGPGAVAVDGSGNVYVTTSNTVRKIGTNGIITTVAGNGQTGFGGDGGPAVSAKINPAGLAFDVNGNLLISDSTNNRIRKVSNGQISTIAGTGQAGAGGDGGPAVSAQLSSPTGIAVDTSNNIYIADFSNARIRRIDPQGNIHTFAGTTAGNSGDGGPATSAQLSNTNGVAVDSRGNVFIADTSQIRMVDSSGTISTVAKGLGNVKGMAGDPSGNVFFADTANSNVGALVPSNNVLITSVQTAGGQNDIAQNTWIAIKGINVGPPGSGPNGVLWSSAPEFASGRMPTQVSNVGATINTKPAYTYYVSPTQVNVLTPLDSVQGPVSVVLKNGVGASQPFTTNLRATSPSFIPIAGGKYIVATHLDGSLVGPPSLGAVFTGAQANETVVMYGFGWGLPSSPLTDGSATQSGSLASMPAIQIGGAPAQVTFAGVISPGLYQFNVTIPAGVSSGDNSLMASYSGASTPAGTVLTIR